MDQAFNSLSGRVLDVSPELAGEVDAAFRCWTRDCEQRAQYLVRVLWACRCDGHPASGLLCGQHLQEIAEMSRSGVMSLDGTVCRFTVDAVAL